MKYWEYRVESQSVTLWHVWPHTARKSMSGVRKVTALGFYLYHRSMNTVFEFGCFTISSFQSFRFYWGLKTCLLSFFVFPPSPKWMNSILVFVTIVSIIINHWLIIRHTTTPPPSSPAATTKSKRIISLPQSDLWTLQPATQLCLRGSLTHDARYWFNYSHLSKSLWSFISPSLTLREINFAP